MPSKAVFSARRNGRGGTSPEREDGGGAPEGGLQERRFGESGKVFRENLNTRDLLQTVIGPIADWETPPAREIRDCE